MRPRAVPRLDREYSESPSRLWLAAAAAILLLVWGYTAAFLPTAGENTGLLVSTVVNLSLFATLIAGLSPLRAAGLLGLLVAAVAAAVSIPLSYLGWEPAANIVKTLAAAGLGYWLAGAITSKGVIVLVAGLSAIVDIASVAAGPTKVLLENAEEAVGYLTVALAWPGYPVGEVHGALGMADLIFFALYVGAARTLALRSTATIVGVAAGIAAAMVAARWVTAMPALPWMAAGFLAVNADLLFRGLRGGRPGQKETSDRS